MMIIKRERETIPFDKLLVEQYFGFSGYHNGVFVKIKPIAELTEINKIVRNAFNLTSNELVSFNDNNSVFRLKNSEIEIN